MVAAWGEGRQHVIYIAKRRDMMMAMRRAHAPPARRKRQHGESVIGRIRRRKVGIEEKATSSGRARATREACMLVGARAHAAIKYRMQRAPFGAPG